MLKTNKQKFSEMRRETTPENHYKSAVLSQEYKEIIKQEFYKNWKTCEHEMLELEGLNTITPSRQPLSIVLKEILQKHGILAGINGDYQEKNLNKILKELKLKCPTCGKELTANLIVGKYLGDDEFWHSFSNFRKRPQLNLHNLSLQYRPRNTKIDSLYRSKSENKPQQDPHQINNNPKVFLFVVYPQEKAIVDYPGKELSKERADSLPQNRMIVSLLKQIVS